MQNNWKGSLSLLIATIIWGSTFVAQSVAMDHMGPFTFQTARCFLAVVALIPVICIADRFQNDGKTFLMRWKDKQLWKAGLLCGIPLFIAASLQQIGITETDAGKSAFLTAMYIVFVPLFGIFRKQKPSRWIPVSVAVAVVGLYFLSCMGVTRISRGDILLIGCAAAYAVQITCVGIFAGTTDALRQNCVNCLICGIFSAAAMWLLETPSLKMLLNCWLPLFYAGVLSMGIAYSLQIIGQKYLDSTPASLIMSLESVFAMICGCLLLNETMTTWEVIGCALLFAAVILSQLPDRKRQPVA